MVVPTQLDTVTGMSRTASRHEIHLGAHVERHEGFLLFRS
jgi:hypothetical protein